MYVLEKASVIGSGLMGSQISLVLAMGSREVALMGRSESSLTKALSNINRYINDLEKHDLLFGGTKEEILDRIWTTTSLEEASDNSNIIIEAVYENLDLKKDIFKRLDKITSYPTILASNTSSIQISKIADVENQPERILGSHFIQPAHIIPIVEVIKAQKTSQEVVERTCNIWEKIGKIPLQIRTDVPGFLVNRLQHAIIREATSLLARGIASAEDIDTAMSLGLAPRFTTAGPLEQRDINGISMHYNVASNLWKDLEGYEIPLNYLRKKIERGELGIQYGKGYYNWTDINPIDVRREKDEVLIRRNKEILAWRKKQSSIFQIKSLKDEEYSPSVKSIKN